MKSTHTYDAIVVGSGITGGWAAKELTEKGLKTLVLERGRDVKHGVDYPHTNKAPWDFPYRKHLTREEKEQYPIQSTKYNFTPASKDFYVNDQKHPYRHPEDKPYMWFRGYQTGGKSLLWGRGAYRFSDLEFEANLKDGIGVDWPIRYKDIAPWYSYVEKFIGVSGTKENIYQFPDGEFLPPFGLNFAEQIAKEKLEAHYSDRKLIPNRVAHITQAAPGQFKGRSACQTRNLCHTGCPYGAYFSSNSSTLPAAYETGNLTLKSHAIVESVIYDEQKDKAVGVRVIDANTKEVTEYYARVIFLCASTLATTGLLLNSKTPRFSDGLANSSGALGHYLMDHHKDLRSSGILEGHLDKTYYGYRPAGVAIPRFRNVHAQEMDFLRGYGVWGFSYRTGMNAAKPGIGAAFKKEMTQPGPWGMTLQSYGECLPYYENKVELHATETDEWGIPLLNISAGFGENEMKMRKDMKVQVREMLEVAGFTQIQVYEGTPRQGDSVHEMGTARMGRDPKTSVLNGFNQCHDVPNLFVTDGSCMTSSGNMSPSLTFMALTARACHYAVEQMKKGNI